MQKLFLFLVFLPSFVFAQVDEYNTIQELESMTIPDPYDPARRLPLDNAGRVECAHSKLKGITPEDCAKAKKFYSEQFSNPDLRFGAMADHIKPHPKYIIYKFLTPKGVTCGSKLNSELKKLCSKAQSMFKSYDKEEQQMFVGELEQKLSPTMLIPLTGKLKCEWSKLSKEKYEYCLKQNSHLDKMLFEERLKHNEQAMMINQLVATIQSLENRCNK